MIHIKTRSVEIELLNFILSMLLVISPFLSAKAESVKEIKTQEEIVREEMIEMSRHLGVTCTECHQVKNFKDDTKSTFKIALEHKKLVQVLKSNGMDGIGKNPMADCFMCHRGKLKPDYLEKQKSH